MALTNPSSLSSPRYSSAFNNLNPPLKRRAIVGRPFHDFDFAAGQLAKVMHEQVDLRVRDAGGFKETGSGRRRQRHNRARDAAAGAAALSAERSELF